MPAVPGGREPAAKVIRHSTSGQIQVLGTCRDWGPQPSPGEWVEVRDPDLGMGEDPVWGPLLYRVLCWPVARTTAGETVGLSRPGGPGPAKLLGWAPA